MSSTRNMSRRWWHCSMQARHSTDAQTPRSKYSNGIQMASFELNEDVAVAGCRGLPNLFPNGRNPQYPGMVYKKSCIGAYRRGYKTSCVCVWPFCRECHGCVRGKLSALAFCWRTEVIRVRGPKQKARAKWRPLSAGCVAASGKAFMTPTTTHGHAHGHKPPV